MASKYRTKHTIPPGFPDILKDFVREILREQPENIYRFGAEYFQVKVGCPKVIFWIFLTCVLFRTIAMICVLFRTHKKLFMFRTHTNSFMFRSIVL
jgi:hypothetical protein